MKKRLLTLSLALIMLFALAVPAAAANSEKEAPNSAATDLLLAMNIVEGMPDGTLQLERNVTRAETAKLIATAKLGGAAAKLTAEGTAFGDVSGDHWAAGFIAYCKNAHILEGVDGNLYLPENAVTMNELMAISLRTLGYGDFVGKDWEKQVDEAASQLPTFSNLSRTSKPAVREDVFETIYQSLFTPTKTDDGQTGATIAEQRNVEVVKLSDNTSTFTIEGMQTGKSYPVPADDAFPAPGVTGITYVPKESGEICVLLDANEKEKTAALLFANGSTQTLKTNSSYANLSGATGKFVAWNSETKLIAPLKCVAGTKDLAPGVTALSEITLAKDVQFIIRTKDEEYLRYLAISGIGRMPTIYEAEYVIYNATDGKQYVYIANGQNSTGYYCRGNMFLPIPNAYTHVNGETAESSYYAVQGTRNSETGTVKFAESYGKTFFATPETVMPGLYMGVEYEGMRVTGVAAGQPSNPLFNSFVGSPKEGAANTPMRGISVQNGAVTLGTNDAFRAAIAKEYSLAAMSALSLKPDGADMKVFFFKIDSDGLMGMSIGGLSDIIDDDMAYVWGTVSSDSRSATSLYVLHSESEAWNARWPLYGKNDSPLKDYKPALLISAAETADAKRTADLLLADGTRKTCTVSSAFDGFKDSADTLVFYKNQSDGTVAITAPACVTGTADILRDAASLNGYAIDSKSVFFIKTSWINDVTYKATANPSARGSVYGAEYSVCAAPDGTSCVYIKNGENSDVFYGGAQVFMLDPANYSTFLGGGGNLLMGTYGAVNGSFGDVNFWEATGKAFFTVTPLRPGLYRGASYSGGAIYNMSSRAPVNPILVECTTNDGLRGFLSEEGFPLNGVDYQYGLFFLGTNEEYISSIRSRLSPLSANFGEFTLTQAVYTAYNDSAKAFCFYIDSSGKVTTEIKKLSELTKDDDAFVWGTLMEENGAKQIANLYIVHSDDTDWTERMLEAYSPVD